MRRYRKSLSSSPIIQIHREVGYSIVIPSFNEEKVIQEVWESLTSVIKKLDSPNEVIFIDDGSSDTFIEIITEICHRQHESKIISFYRNFGHQQAISA